MSDLLQQIVAAVVMATVAAVFAYFNNKLSNTIDVLKTRIIEAERKHDLLIDAHYKLREELIRRPCFVDSKTKSRRDEE